MQRAKHVSIFILQLLVLVGGNYLPPVRLDGFIYKKHSISFDTTLIEAFYDPLCPDSRDSWPPLKQALNYYGSHVSLVLHIIPLPYHDNAFFAARALHVVNDLNRSATFPLLESFFKYQEYFYGAPTWNLSRAFVQEEIVKFTAAIVGNSYYNSIKDGFNNSHTDIQTRVSFKYAALRGVYGTPSFYVNGFLLPDTGATYNYSTWRNVIDPLIAVKKNIKDEDSVHFS